MPTKNANFDPGKRRPINETPLLATLLLLATTGWAEFRAGSAKVDITPKVWPVQLVGSFSGSRTRRMILFSLVRLCVMTAKRGWPL